MRRKGIFFRKRAGRFLLGGVVFITVITAGTAVVMCLWNALVPSIIGWSAITYWQAAGLIVLCRMLFGGFGKFGAPGYHRRHGHHFHGMSCREKREYIRSRIQREFGDRLTGEQTDE
jgi:hypothetical protein